MKLKKYLTYTAVILAILLLDFSIAELYKNNYANNSKNPGGYEELQNKLVQLENNNIEQAKTIQELKDEISQIDEEKIKDLEKITNELQTSIKNDNTKQLELRLSEAEKSIDILNTFASKNSTADSYLFGKIVDDIRN